MAGSKDENGEEVIKQGLMTKRSQNKKRFTPINYKQRWFILTRKSLTYYDIDGEVNFIKSVNSITIKVFLLSFMKRCFICNN